MEQDTHIHPVTGLMTVVKTAVFKVQVWPDVMDAFGNYFQAQGDLKAQWAVYLKQIASLRSFRQDSFEWLGKEMKRVLSTPDSYILFETDEDATRFLNLASEFHQGIEGLKNGS